MVNMIGDVEISEDALAQMRNQGGTWAVYQNHALEDMTGDLRFLKIGPECTFESPPTKYPDTHLGTGWRYVHVGSVDLETGTII